MPGVEVVAGLALAVLPLLVSAAQQYEKFLHPFLQFKKFAADMKESHKQFLI